MKKAVIFPILALLTLLSFTLYNGVFMERCTDRWQEQLRQTASFVKAEAWDRAQLTLEQSYADWSARQTYLHIVSTHDGVNAAEVMYLRAMAFIAEQEPSELQAEIAELQAQLCFLAQMEQFSIHNIL